MSLLTGFRNLIGRKREAETGVAVEAETDVAVVAEIEAKPPEPEVENIRYERDDDRVVETAREVVQRLEAIDDRLGARGAETQRLVKELDGHIESSFGRTEQLVQRLDARGEMQAAESKQITDQLGQVLELGGDVAQIKQQCASLLERIDEQLNRSQDHGAVDEAINAAVSTAVDAAAKRFGEALERSGESLQQMRAQLDSTARSVSHADERSEGLVHALRDIQERTAGLDDAITRIGRTVRQREDKLIELLSRTKRSMTLFAYGCTLASLLAVGIAAVAIFMH